MNLFFSLVFFIFNFTFFLDLSFACCSAASEGEVERLKVVEYKHFKFCPGTRQFSGGFWNDVDKVVKNDPLKLVPPNKDLDFGRILNDLFYLIILEPNIIVIRYERVYVSRYRSITSIYLAPEFDNLIESIGESKLEGFSAKTLKNQLPILMNFLSNSMIYYFQYLAIAKKLPARTIAVQDNLKPAAEFYTSLTEAIQNFQLEIKKSRLRN